VTRVIGGTAGGRRLAVPPGGTRPTSDRAREGIFSALASLRGGLEGAALLDLYAGSGAVGLEALSRGAAQVVFVEADRRVAQTLHENVERVGLGGRVVVGRVQDVLLREPLMAADVVFADPPYAVEADELGRVLGLLRGRGWLGPGAIVTVERASRDRPFQWPPGYRGLRSRRYGEATVWYGRAAAGTE
jgi:16S rRNA (guanine966-N2)-methyltransferase